MSFKNPVPTVGIIIEQDGGIFLIERKNPPHGGHCLEGLLTMESPWNPRPAREALEETGLIVDLLGQFHTYSDPDCDSRQHTISTVFIARATGNPQAGSDARKAGLFTKNTLP